MAILEMNGNELGLPDPESKVYFDLLRKGSEADRKRGITVGVVISSQNEKRITHTIESGTDEKYENAVATIQTADGPAHVLPTEIKNGLKLADVVHFMQLNLNRFGDSGGHNDLDITPISSDRSHELAGARMIGEDLPISLLKPLRAYLGRGDGIGGVSPWERK